jgi:hypothetical protein
MLAKQYMRLETKEKAIFVMNCISRFIQTYVERNNWFVLSYVVVCDWVEAVEQANFVLLFFVPTELLDVTFNYNSVNKMIVNMEQYFSVETRRVILRSKPMFEDYYYEFNQREDYRTVRYDYPVT